ncbi:MAG: hypothetical protein A2790_02020 [Phenylobacterium sp. RIFCSPHIGHO2_01_FULL_69_31]|jgi:hypothetical protein|uniref:hypothetical protein n=1 Tax=Phenylobacterium sp. RIFCSPHIGHO2_01_FULL_69_31 TaxID=1801944 RepID=UPI0008BF2CCC|nr:hypothetical protein [Phenylobacterium sp. RIFCSPHIGHO2_01_FULL_69_31]OHB31318.1 MAG: hypothetical protein A2790_02020 [Phenylobacterium sp. RIFCSPHIGHO2_01_FULL_69_31]
MKTTTVALMAAAVALAGCQSLRKEKPKPVAPAPVVVPVIPLPKPPPPPPPPAPPPPPPKSCVPRNLPPPPRYPDTDGALRAAPGAADRYQLMAAGRILRMERLQDLERVIAGCR